MDYYVNNCVVLWPTNNCVGTFCSVHDYWKPVSETEKYMCMYSDFIYKKFSHKKTANITKPVQQCICCFSRKSGILLLAAYIPFAATYPSKIVRSKSLTILFLKKQPICLLKKRILSILTTQPFYCILNTQYLYFKHPIVWVYMPKSGMQERKPEGLLTKEWKVI